MPDKIKQADFVNKLREKIPDLKDFSDVQIMNRILKMRPELRNSIETPDDAAAAEQARLEKRSHSMVDPEYWKDHPTLGAFTRSALSALPGTGAIVGGLAATPETMGAATLAGGAIGAGAGRGLQDITNQMLGLEDTSPMQKAKNIALDTALTAATPGAMEIAKSPVSSVKMAAEDLGKTGKYMIPGRLRPFLPFLENVSEKNSSRVNREVEDAISHFRDYNTPAESVVKGSNAIKSKPDAWDTLLNETKNPPKMTGPEPNLKVDTSDLLSPYTRLGPEPILNTGGPTLPTPTTDEFLQSIENYLSPKDITYVRRGFP